MLKIVPSQQDHGFVAHRRRGAAIFIAQVNCWRLRRLRRSFVMSFKDMTDAFGSSDWSELEVAIARSTSEENRALCQQR
eukprot:2355748-Pyramimonas_sp.AAC.1